MSTSWQREILTSHDAIMWRRSKCEGSWQCSRRWSDLNQRGWASETWNWKLKQWYLTLKQRCLRRARVKNKGFPSRSIEMVSMRKSSTTGNKEEKSQGMLSCASSGNGIRWKIMTNWESFEADMRRRWSFERRHEAKLIAISRWNSFSRVRRRLFSSATTCRRERIESI